jgi:hypothetical protein
MTRTVQLREEHKGKDDRYLSASLDDEGNLVIEGQDLGPGTAVVSSDGEYEWTRVIRAKDIPQLLRLLDAPIDADVLAESWRANSYELERRIRHGKLPSSLSVWS